MTSSSAKIHVLLTATGLFAATVLGQAPALLQVEPGLERAVRWKWQIAPSDMRQWGLPLRAVPFYPTNLPATPSGVPAAGNTHASGSSTYIVKRGDALILIAKRHKVPLDVLKKVNGLEKDTIRVGDALQIPTLEEVAALSPKVTASKPAGAEAPTTKGLAQTELEILTLQVFLDRQQYSPGPINGRRSPIFDKILRLYQNARGGSADPAAFQQRALAALGGDPLTRYRLRPEDFRFISAPQAERVDPAATPTPTQKKKSQKVAPVSQPRPTYGQLTAVRMLAYRSPWEFVAERFHCDEAYLRKLNPHLGNIPVAGEEFVVPKVAAFEIENALAGTLQPPADSAIPVTAAVLDLSLLEISRGGRTIALLPLSIARPGLRGRDPWVIRDAVPRPQLVSVQEPLVKPQPPTRIYGTSTPTPTPKPTPVPTKQVLAAGPRNPVGIIWINLAKDATSEPLPYGLHGTSIPGYMSSQESIGGLRLANWDIARAVHLLPAGTKLEWKEARLPIAAPAAKPAP
jgi:LysM repeat protein